MGKRKAVKAMMDSVERGHAFTIIAKGEPVAMVLPWSDWHALNQKLVELERLHAGEQILPPPVRPIPEDQWGQGDVAMATEEDEARLLRTFGKSSDELADEAEQGYDTAGMRHRERQAMRKYGITPPREMTAGTSEGEDFLPPEKIR